MKKFYNIGIVGATGLVGGELIQLLSRENFPAEKVRLFAGVEDAGERLEFQGEQILVQPIAADFHQDLDIIFFAAHPLVSRDLAEQAAKAGALVIDASRAFRLEKDVPLVVAEVNPKALERAKDGMRIIASPGPATVGLSLALNPISKKLEIKRSLALAIYGSTAEGRAGFEEHQNQTVAIFNNQEFEVEKFPRQMAFNIFPQVGRFVTDSTEEEMDIEQELKKILEFPRLKFSATCVHAPVFAGLSIFVCLETRQQAEVEEIRILLKDQPGILVRDNPEQEEYPDVLSCLETDQVLAGRIRKDPLSNSGFQFWLNLDNLRKGSALNMLQIAQEIIEQELI